MKAIFVLVFVIILAICFVFDPTPTVTEDMTDKTIDRNLYNTVSLDSSNNDNYNKKNVDSNHYCPKCNSHSLSFEGLNTSEGKRIHLINCNDCNFEWQEIWTLPNWFWLKSSSDNNWTAQRWNVG
jgi:hypothetical protein